MSRRNKDSFEELLELLADMPWWVSILFGALVYGLLRFIGPAIFPDAKTLPGMLVGVGSQLSWMSVIFVAPALVSLFRAAGKSRVLDRQSGLESIRALSWKRFEELLGEAYRRQGFTVFENPGKGADGGIDLTIKRGGETYLVQCKQWKTYKVGVKVVREMLGLVTAHGATGAIVVTSGVFTKEAEAFAATQSIELVDGDALVRLIGEVQVRPAMVASTPAPVARVCPRCGQELVLRQAKRGPNAGGRFWGCSGYPRCRHTEQVAG
jgi:restriction system protein